MTRIYYQHDAKKLAKDIAAAIPEATVENWRDHGFAVDVIYQNKLCVACEPPIHEGDEGIFHTVEEVKKILGVE